MRVGRRVCGQGPGMGFIMLQATPEVFSGGSYLNVDTTAEALGRQLGDRVAWLEA